MAPQSVNLVLPPTRTSSIPKPSKPTHEEVPKNTTISSTSISHTAAKKNRLSVLHAEEAGEQSNSDIEGSSDDDTTEGSGMHINTESGNQQSNTVDIPTTDASIFGPDGEGGGESGGQHSSNFEVPIHITSTFGPDGETGGQHSSNFEAPINDSSI